MARAVLTGHKETLEILLKKYLFVYNDIYKDTFLQTFEADVEYTLLLMAIEKCTEDDCLEKVKLLIEYGADYNKELNKGEKIPIFPVLYSVFILLFPGTDAKWDPLYDPYTCTRTSREDCRKSWIWNPIKLAAKRGLVDVLQVLIKRVTVNNDRILHVLLNQAIFAAWKASNFIKAVKILEFVTSNSWYRYFFLLFISK